MSERLTVAQALVRFLAVQEIERDGERRRFFGGCWGIFGHGNLSGLGQALQQHRDLFRYRQARNEQAMVHVASGYARQLNRLGTFACTSSVGPGATNMVTGAALATVNRLPVLLLPGDTFATRAPHPVLQQLEAPHDATMSVNDCFRPVSRYFDRITRPEQIVPSALEAMRVLTDPAETGAVTLALPEDVQTEALELPESFLAPRVWTVFRRPPAPDALARAAELVRAAQRPLIVAGGGVIYAEATEELRALAEAAGIPVCETQAGRGVAALGPPARARRRRRDRHARRQPAGPRGGPRDRGRHALERLHDRLEVGLPGPGRALRERQRRELRRRQAQRARARGGREAGAGGARRGARGPPRRRGLGRGAPPTRRAPGARRSRASRTPATRRCRARPR